MATKYDRFHFGDVVVNKFAGASSPTKIGMVTRVSVTNGLVSHEPVLHLSGVDGSQWSYAGPPEALEIVGRGLPDRVCP